MSLFSFEAESKILSLIYLYLSAEDLRDAFCVAGGAFGRPWMVSRKTVGIKGGTA